MDQQVVRPVAVRLLTAQERALSRWMLEHGTPEAREFLTQLDRAEGTTWRCPCGCPSFSFSVAGLPPAPPGVHILGDFVYGPEDAPNFIMIYESHGILSAVEVSYFADKPPTELPATNELRAHFSDRRD